MYLCTRTAFRENFDKLHKLSRRCKSKVNGFTTNFATRHQENCTCNLVNTVKLSWGNSSTFMIMYLLFHALKKSANIPFSIYLLSPHKSFLCSLWRHLFAFFLKMIKIVCLSLRELPFLKNTMVICLVNARRLSARNLSGRYSVTIGRPLLFANLFLCPKEERVLECNARLRNFKLYSVGWYC